MFTIIFLIARLTANFFCAVQDDDDVTCHVLPRVIRTPLIVKYYPEVLEAHVDRFASNFRFNCFSFRMTPLDYSILRCVFTDDLTRCTNLCYSRRSRYIELLVGVGHVGILSGLRRRRVTWSASTLRSTGPSLFWIAQAIWQGTRLFETTMQNLISYSKSLDVQSAWFYFF